MLPRPMNEAVIAEFDTIVEVATALRPIMVAAHIVLRNLNELQKFAREHQKASSITQLKFDVGWAIQFKIDACRHMLNILSSFRAFLDHCDSYLCENYGKNSKERVRFKTETSRQYDTSNAYRFLSKLRNYAQHSSLPISHVNVSVKLNHPEKSFATELQLRLDRDTLLSWDRWGAITEEVSKMDKSIEILPIFEEMDKSVNELAATIFSERADELLRCQDYLERVSAILKAPEGAILVVWVGDHKSDGTPPGHTELFPVDELRLINEAMGSVLQV